MAKIVGPIEDIVLSVEAKGQNLWGMDVVTEPDKVTEQLIEFASWTRDNQLIHGDLRPWNVFVDSNCGVQVIDWWLLSAFTDDLLTHRKDLVEADGHYTKCHPELVAQHKFTEIDLTDARSIGKLLRGEIGREEYESWAKSGCPGSA